MAALGEPDGQARAQPTLFITADGQPLVLFPVLFDGQQGVALSAGDHQFFVDGGEIVESPHDLDGALEHRVVLQHEVPEQGVDAVQLLQTGGAVEQGEGTVADAEEALQLGQVGLFVVGDAEIGDLLLLLPQRPEATLLVQFQPFVHLPPVALVEDPGPFQIGLAGRRAFQPVDAADLHRFFLAVVKFGGDGADGLARTGDVAVVLVVALAGLAAHVGDPVAITFMAAGGGQVVARAFAEQGHEGVHQGSLAAAGGADDGRALGVDVHMVTPGERPPVVQVQGA